MVLFDVLPSMFGEFDWKQTAVENQRVAADGHQQSGWSGWSERARSRSEGGQGVPTSDILGLMGRVLMVGSAPRSSSALIIGMWPDMQAR